MNRYGFARRILFALPFVLLLVCSLSSALSAQSVPQLPAPTTPSNDCGCPRGDDGIPVSSGMLAPFLPKVPNLEFGFQYYFGNRVRTGRFSADYVLPFHLSPNSVLFGEAHGEGWGFWKKPNLSVAAASGFTVTTTDTSNRVDLSFGGGYRTMLGANTMLGVNGFYDTSRLFKKWYSSGGVGLEMAANVAGDDAIDLNFNWYGNLFNRDVLVNAFRNMGNSFDVEAGYSHALFNQALDLRFKVIGYQFDIGTPVIGWRGGADLTTRNGMFTLRYEYGHDKVDGHYNTVGGFINVGFQLENLLSGESPFTLPEPVFRSPRDLRRSLGMKVKRNWHQPAAVVVQRASAKVGPPCPPLLGSRIQDTPTLISDAFYHPTPSLPDLPPYSDQDFEVTVCWVGLREQGTLTAITLMVKQIGTNAGVALFDWAQVLTPPISMATPCGCVTVTIYRMTYACQQCVSNTVSLNLSGGPLLFYEGGGISIVY